VTDLDPALLAEAEQFAAEVAEVLSGTVTPDDIAVAARVHEARVVVGPVNEQGLPSKLTLPVTETATVRLDISFSCSWDSEGKYLMVQRSAFKISIGHVKEPLIRFEYVRSRDYAPAHVQVHAESGALGLHLGAIGSTKLPKLQDLHLPVGGKRFRVSLEDVIEFLVEDLDVPPKDGWEDVIQSGRTRWFARQLGAVVRSDQQTAVRTLEDLGYTVQPP
jgi:hypothetical protein